MTTSTTHVPAAEPTIHDVIRASAGAGKTFQLSNRYLHLLREGASPDAILATTFTRKAAGEILSRVLVRLAGGAIDTKGAAALARELGDPSLRLTDCRRMLVSVCGSLHRVGISTIDSFFSRIVQGFRHELGVPPGARIVAQDDPSVKPIRTQAIEAMLADDEPAVLIDLLRRLHHDTAKRSVTEAIDEIVLSLYDVYRQSTPECWAKLDPPPTLSRDELNDAIEALSALVGTLTSKAIAKGVAPNLSAAQAHDWEKFLGSGLAAKVDTDPPIYQRVPITGDVLEVYRPLMAHARAELITRVARQTGATFELLKRFDEHYVKLRNAQRIMLFSDLPHKLAREMPARGDDALMEMYYRLDARVGHLMLDEFQDTSVEQWDVLRPMAEEIVSHSDGSHSFFCVGDGKQAIYGWRGGCAEIFDRVESDLRLPTSSKQLSTSYRSSPAIMKTVNSLFSDIASSPALAGESPNVVTQWCERFSHHTTTHAKRAGYAELITSPVPPEPEEESSEAGEGEVAQAGGSAHDEYVAKRIAEWSKALPHGATLGVLVSTNAHVHTLVDDLHKLHVDASGEGGNPVTDDPAVGVVMSAFTLADHPGDTAAAFHVRHSPLATVVGLDAMTPEARGRVALAIRTDLVRRGYAAVVADWMRALAPSCSERSLGRMMQLVELADRFERDAGLRAGAFVTYVSETPVEQPSPAAVRIMTVHKAKGLEFDVVVLPQLERALLATSGESVYTLRDSPTMPIKAVFRATNELVRAQCPEVEEAYQQERGRRLRDDLCSLYVAMTRAKFALHMIVKPLKPLKSGAPSTKGWSNLSFASILRRGLGPADPSFAGEETLYQYGQSDWAKAFPARKSGDTTGDASLAQLAPPRPKLAAPAANARRAWAVVTPSSLEASGKVEAADLLAMEGAPQRLRGSVMHAWFVAVGFIGRDDLPADERLREMAQRMPGVEATSIGAMIKDFRAMLARPAIAAALAPRDGVDCELWRERSFAVRVEGDMIQGRFDRVVVERWGGKVAGATLIDFKTDMFSPATRDGLIETYRPQMQAYRRAIAAMLGLPAEKVAARLLFVGAGEVVEV